MSMSVPSTRTIVTRMQTVPTGTAPTTALATMGMRVMVFHALVRVHFKGYTYLLCCVSQYRHNFASNVFSHLDFVALSSMNINAFNSRH